MAKLTLKIEHKKESNGQHVVHVVDPDFGAVLRYRDEKEKQIVEDTYREFACRVFYRKRFHNQPVPGLEEDGKEELTVVFVE